MADPNRPRLEELFPKLSAAQLSRLSRIGGRRRVERGEIVVEQGTVSPDLFAVLTGRLSVVHPVDDRELVLAELGEGQFTGEVSLVSGRRTLVRIRASEAGEVLAVPHAALRKLMADDAELGELLLRTFVLRRVELIAHGQGGTVVLGSVHSAGTLRVREFLGRNDEPYVYLEVERDPGVQGLLDRFALQVADVPVVIYRNERVLKNPSNAALADCLGFDRAFAPTEVRDLVIVGAGPAGLAAAVYGASEGLDVLVLEGQAPGGQAGSSSRIENYLGFPTGISGQELAGRAFVQAEKFGAEVAIGRTVVSLQCGSRPYALGLSDGTQVRARAVVIASGVQYRKPASTGLERYEGLGVYYAATRMEAQLCAGEEVVVIGGANSAGQAAVFLASIASRVHILVRGPGLAESMSRYLIARIEESPNITLCVHQQVTRAEGREHLEAVQVRDSSTGETRTLPVRHVFVMTGADPNTGWLRGCVALDEKGFVRTGADLRHDDLATWPLSRQPHLWETSAPGIFAVGDVRASSMKRVASAVGEGSAAIQLVHRFLAE